MKCEAIINFFLLLLLLCCTFVTKNQYAVLLSLWKIKRERKVGTEFFFFSLEEREKFIAYLYGIFTSLERLLTLNCPFLSFSSLSLCVSFLLCGKSPIGETAGIVKEGIVFFLCSLFLSFSFSIFWVFPFSGFGFFFFLFGY